MTPIIASLHAEHDRATLERTLRSTTTASSVVSAVGATVLILLAPLLLRILFGFEYVDSHSIVTILTVGALFNVFSGSAGATLLMTGHQRVFALFTLLGLAMGIVLVKIGYVRGDVAGVAVAASLVISVRSAAMSFVDHRRLGVWTVAYVRPKVAVQAVQSLGGVSAATARWCPADSETGGTDAHTPDDAH